MSKAWEVFRFELAYQCSRVSTRIYFAIFLALSLMMTFIFINDARNDGYFFNAPIITAAVTIINSLFALLVVAAVGGDAATRDHETRLDSLLYTTPIGKAAYLGGRFAGAFAVTALLLLAVPIALLATTALPSLEPELIGPFRADAYLIAYFFFAVPNALICTAIIFSLAAVTRSTVAGYAGAAFLFFASFFSEGFFGGNLGQWALGRLADPLGFTTLISIWRTYNPLQKNTLPVPIDGILLGNRLLWLGVALSALAIAMARFRFAYVGGSNSRFAPHPSPLPAERGEGTVVAPVILSEAKDLQMRSSRNWRPFAVSAAQGDVVPVPRREFGVSTRIRQLLAITGESFRELHASRAWLIAPLVAVLFIITAPELLEVELGTPGAATTARVASLYAASENALLLILLIALSASQLVWRERDARINAIADAAPLPEWLSVTGKFLAIALMLAAAHAIFLVSGLIVQASAGSFRFDFGIYLKILFGFQLSGFLLLAALAMVLHVLVNQKYVANVLVILVHLGLDLMPELGVKHNLLRYGRAPAWSYSEMAGFGSQVGPWLWFTAYWSGWALLFAVVSYLFWIRGEERGARARLLLARRRMTRWPVSIGATALLVIAGVGGFIFYNTNVLNPFYTDAEVEQRKAEYERRYGKYATLPQPILDAKKLQVDFYPERSAATIRGTYRLENRSGVAIDSIHLTPYLGAETKGVTFDRPSRVALADDDLGYRIYALDRPLQPGESVRMDFQLVYAPRGFRNDGRDPSVMHNGSWIEHRGDQNQTQRYWLPAIGYQPGRELNTAAARKEHGLRARPAVPSLDNVTARRDERSHEKIEFEAIVGTSADQIGVTTGALRRTWTENGRNYAHYVAEAPLSNGYVIHSAKYAVHRASWRNVAIEIFHHPTHTANLDRMLRSVRASLDYHTRHFGPYPHKQLRLIEFPSSARGLGLSAHDGAIKYSEGYALVRPEDDARRIDLPFAVMAHEIAHQWWAHQIVPALVEGAPVLSESLAWYSAMLVIEETLGREHLMRLLDVMRSEYMAPHQTRQVPLLRAVDTLDAYRTGPFAMFALREAIGPERVNLALRNLLAKFNPTRRPYPTSLDLYAELRAVTPPDRHELLKDLFEEITFWDLRTKKVDVQRVNDAYRVTLHVEAQKLKANALGKEKPVPMNDAIEVAVFDSDGKALYRAPHRIRSGAQAITVMVARAPARAGVDPDHELLDRKVGDNEGIVVGAMPGS